jgi:hypothetical protein
MDFNKKRFIWVCSTYRLWADLQLTKGPKYEPKNQVGSPSVSKHQTNVTLWNGQALVIIVV